MLEDVEAAETGTERNFIKHCGANRKARTLLFFSHR